MALIKCPECGNVVNDAATSCPNCGFVLKEMKDAGNIENAWISPEYENEKKKKEKLKKRLIVIIIILLFAIIVHNKLEKYREIKIYNASFYVREIYLFNSVWGINSYDEYKDVFVIHAGKSEMYTIDKGKLTDTGADYIRKMLDKYISNKKQ
ncbi:MAG: zinc ribbon domain-containing protein [Lachnospiraceae bacterium]|nr:zinc ribbon domain-containing protein [Lachnospiraceae bacterium]